MSKEFKINLFLLLIIFLLTISVFCQVYAFSFINFDDNVYVTNNPQVLAGLSWDSIKWSFTTTLGGHWHPLSWLSHMLDVSLFGLNPKWHHIVNVVIHACNACLLYLIVLTLVSKKEIAFFTTLIFAIHPLRIESVAWVTERKDVLSMFFGLIALELYLKFIKRFSQKYYYFSLFSFSLSLLAKPTFITFPFLLFLLDFWPLNRLNPQEVNTQKKKSLNELITEKLPFLTVAIVFSITTILAQNLGGGLRSFEEVPFTQRLDTAIPAYLAYLGKLFWPTGLIIFYPQINYPSGIVVGSLIALTLITFILFKARFSNPQLLFGWLWFLISATPMSGIIAVGGQAFADRWTYLPHIGLIMALVTLCYEHFHKKAFLVLFLISTLLILQTLSHLPNWKTSETVFKHALAVDPNNFMAHTNLGAALFETNRISEASYHYEEAIRLNPTYPEALNNLGTLRATQGRVDLALKEFEKALKIRPNFTIAEKNRIQALKDLGMMQKGQN